MSPVLVAHLVATAAYAGFQWTVHLVVYRQLPAVPRSPMGAFEAYERQHQRLITPLVGVLFGALTITTVLLLVLAPAGSPLWLRVTAAAMLLIVVGVTGLLAVPEHRRLSDGWDPAAYRRLLRVDLARTVAATVNVAAAAALLAG